MVCAKKNVHSVASKLISILSENVFFMDKVCYGTSEHITSTHVGFL